MRKLLCTSVCAEGSLGLRQNKVLIRRNFRAKLCPCLYTSKATIIQEKRIKFKKKNLSFKMETKIRIFISRTKSCDLSLKNTFPKEFFNDILVIEHKTIYSAEIRCEKMFCFKMAANPF